MVCAVCKPSFLTPVIRVCLPQHALEVNYLCIQSLQRKPVCFLCLVSVNSLLWSFKGTGFKITRVRVYTFANEVAISSCSYQEAYSQQFHGCWIIRANYFQLSLWESGVLAQDLKLRHTENPIASLVCQTHLRRLSTMLVSLILMGVMHPSHFLHVHHCAATYKGWTRHLVTSEHNIHVQSTWLKQE